MVSLESIVDRQIRQWELKKESIYKNGEPGPRPKAIITVSRQQGSRGSFFAKRLAERLGFEIFHRELIDFICRDAGCRRRLIESLDEKLIPQLQLWVEGILKGKIVDVSDYMQWLAKSIYTIASHGGAVIVGRGANFILKLNTGLHIRVVAPVSDRISNMIEFKGLTVKEAEKTIEESDKARREFIRKNFDYDINDPVHYDLVLNTAYIDIDSALDLAQKGLQSKMHIIEMKNH
ncbi:MAG: hypothetical protein CO189_02645 [candidate division Zixibacteria bacterium CG_4_9_14_3_um_filter_46_8]|nr:MAG: hypothetical protein CO189_02645 [candidate division Zixibacteria bacterium CG_4_9_14_3_um_filter_46_8]